MTRPPRHLWRQFHIISSTPDDCRNQAMGQLQGRPALWVSPDPPDGVPGIAPDQVARYLGQDIDHLVFDAREDLDPDALAIAAGLVRGGGLFLLLTPNLRTWGQQPQSLFLQRMARLCRQQEQPQEPPAIARSTAALTREQVQVIQALDKTATGHRNRPLVVIADRGRGKSSALGIGAAKLLTRGIQDILVTAPRLDATNTLFQQAARELGGVKHSRGELRHGEARLHFMAPDKLLEQLPDTRLLLVDEAAGIPLPMLEKLLQHYHRIAFASTVHGYEGSGRGFSLRFSQTLDRHCRQWKKLTLMEPVRWAPGDPLEAFIFQTLLLDAEPAPVTIGPGRLDTSRLEISPLDRKALARDDARLEQLFGLLVDAHYRTTPTDLRHLLDAPGLSIHTAGQDGTIVAALLVVREGRLPTALHPGVLAGQRRPRGQLLPTILASHCGFPEALDLDWERVLRIAVHPRLQGQGIGSHMLSYLKKDAAARGVDLLGASFGATTDLLDFWQGNGYVPVRLGQRREASSGAHAATWLQGLSAAGQKLQSRAQGAFQKLFPVQLGEPFSKLPPPLARRLFREEPGLGIGNRHRRILESFAAGQRQYTDALGALHELARTDAAVQPVLILKVLQGRNWSETADILGLPGKKAVLKSLRATVATWLQAHPLE
ncbi:tRNA(Met) cytidine acetyltransferase TmcA [Thiolapillus brandeum]|uniref:tRNA(Met) cytidine acetyltransferase TmcA n=1 Tax=Thiolapillus brandeum TaxID=1076588 RepID=A0A7U6GL67_9GAMM|nr:GNAT family N-acetyltransferase [Thiolapillus brandeum]BAO45650.1 conserved hypothetical protein [Thiolapillus brandeum]